MMRKPTYKNVALPSSKTVLPIAEKLVAAAAATVVIASRKDLKQQQQSNSIIQPTEGLWKVFGEQLSNQTMSNISFTLLPFAIALCFVFCCSASNPLEGKFVATELMHPRFRRGFGYRTICIKQPIKFCTMIKHGAVLKKYCIDGSLSKVQIRAWSLGKRLTYH